MKRRTLQVVGMMALGLAQIHAQSTPNVTLSGQLQGANGAPAANTTLTFEPTQPFTLVGTGTPGGCAGGTVLEHNGGPLANQCLLNFNDTTPAPPAGYTNVIFQSDANGNLSAYASSSGGGGSCGPLGGDATSTNCGTGNFSNYTGVSPAYNQAYGDSNMGNVGGLNHGYNLAFGSNSLIGASSGVGQDILAGGDFAANPIYPGTSDLVAFGDSPADNVAINNSICLGDAPCNPFDQTSANTLTGNNLIALGQDALGGSKGTTVINDVIAIGQTAGNGLNASSATNAELVFVGDAAGSGGYTGAVSDLVLIGQAAGATHPSVYSPNTFAPSNVVGVGQAAAADNGGSNVVGVGLSAATHFATGSHDVIGIGNSAMTGSEIGTSPTVIPVVHDAIGIGQGAGGRNSGVGILAIGDWTLGQTNCGSGFTGNTGNYNTAIGDHALAANGAGTHNVVMGYFAGSNGWTDCNPGDAGNSNITGSNNTWIGDGSGPNTTSQLSNTIALGYNAQVSASNQTVIGNSSITSLKLFGCPTGQTVYDDGSGNCYVPGSGGSGGSNVGVNGGAALPTVNLNGTTPAAGANFINGTWQVSGSNVSVEVPYATSGAFGVVKPDGTSITISGGVLSAVGSAGGTSGQGSEITSATTQSIPSATDTIVTLATVVNDNGGYSGTANTFTVPAGLGGWYIITGAARWAANSNGERDLWIKKNGSFTVGPIGSSIVPVASPANPGGQAAYVTKLNAGDTITLDAFQTSGSSLNLLNATLSMAYLGNSGSVPFSGITTATNTSATMTCGTGCSILTAGSGSINATLLGGVALSGLCQTGGTGCPQLPVTKAAASHQWLNSYTASTGAFTAAQPTFGDISGQATLAQLPNGTTNSVLLGYGSSGSGSPPTQITLGTNLSITGTTLNATGSGLPCSGTCTAGILPLFGAGGASITNSLLDYGVTTASTFTFGAGVNIGATAFPSQLALTYDSLAPTVGGATTATYAVNSSGQAVVADGSGAFSRPCTAANYGTLCPASGSGDTITSPQGTLNVGGTSTATTLDLKGAAGEIMAGATPALTYTPTLGVSGTAGTLSMYPASGNFTTTWGSAATASNTILGFATAPTTGDLIDCVTSSTTCTLTDSGVPAANVATAASNFAANRVILGGGSNKTLTSVGGITTDGVSILELGVAGSSVGQVQLFNATSGSITVAPVTGALGSVTASLPANTGTLAELNLAETWTALQTFGASNASIGTTAHGLLVSESASAVATTAAGTAKQILVSGGGSADPNYIDFPLNLIIPAANCNNTTAGTSWSLPASAAPTVACRTGTNVTYGVLQYAASNTAQFQINLPADYDSSGTVYALIHFTQGGNTTSGQTIIMQMATACSTTTDDPTFNTAQSFATATTGTTANTPYDETLSSVTMTGCTAGHAMNVKISRSGSDTATTAPNVAYVSLTIPRLLTNQAN